MDSGVSTGLGIEYLEIALPLHKMSRPASLVRAECTRASHSKWMRPKFKDVERARRARLLR